MPGKALLVVGEVNNDEDRPNFSAGNHAAGGRAAEIHAAGSFPFEQGASG